MKACIGGTFDCLHEGHKRFLDAVFRQADSVFVGIVSDDFVKAHKALPEKVQLLEERKKALKAYLYTAGWLAKATIKEIKDECGPAVKATDLEAIFCTPKTKANALKINEERIRVALKPLRIIEVQLLNAADGRPISSARIRAGEIDSTGRLVPKVGEEE